MSQHETLEETIALRNRNDAMKAKKPDVVYANRIDELRDHIRNLHAKRVEIELQISESMARFNTLLRDQRTEQRPLRPLGPDHSMIEVHPTKAHIYDTVMAKGEYTIFRALNPKNTAIVNKFCCELVDLGIARWTDINTIVRIENPIPMPEPAR